MKSIALKLWLAMMSLVIIVLILLWFFQIVFLEQFYIKMRISDITKSGIEIVNILEREDQSKFEEEMDKLAYNNNLTAELMDLQRNILYWSGTTGMSSQMPMMRNYLRKELYNQVFVGETVSVPLTHPRFGSSFMLIGIPVKVNEKIQGGLFINLPLLPVKDTVNILKIQLIYITIILFITAIVVSYLLSKTFTRPILDIIKVAMLMAKGDLTARIHFKRRDEIAKLGEAINYMGKELSKVDQLRKDLIANISHELRTPLSLIKGYAETIKDVSGNSPEKREKHLDIIIDETNRLSGMVQEILDFSQMQAGYISLDIKRFKINDTINKVYKRFEILSAKARIEFILNIQEEFFVVADEVRIEQVLYNLLNNALNHSAENGKITVSIFEGEGIIRIEVEDNGEGIPGSELPYIWDRFYKVDKSGMRKKSGTGLGLAIVKSILTAHQCKYGVESKEGIRTKFWFELKQS